MSPRSHRKPNRKHLGQPGAGQFAANPGGPESQVTLAAAPARPTPLMVPPRRPQPVALAPLPLPRPAPKLDVDFRRPADAPAPDRFHGEDIQLRNYMYDDMEAFIFDDDDIIDVDPLNAPARQISQFQSLASYGYPNAL